jgi:2-dehydropantoate 2-reductase
LFKQSGKKMRILIYGAGVIGCLYGALLSEAGYNVSVYARGKRLECLQTNGLRYVMNKKTRTASVTVLARLEPNDRYDFIFLTVRENQLHTALKELKENCSPTIVTMVNSLEPYEKWEAVCGQGRIVPAFPGAGGGFEGDTLNAALTPRIIQPTTVGRTGGKEKTLASVFRKAGIPCQIVRDMRAWQICHLAMVVPIADAYYEATDPANAGKDHALMHNTAVQIKRNLRDTAEIGIKLSPVKMHLFRILPSSIIAIVLGFVFRSGFGDRFMYRHSMKAPDEMRCLHKQFYAFVQQDGFTNRD